MTLQKIKYEHIKFYIILVTLFAVNGSIAQWTSQNPLPQDKLLSSVFFTDANTGYAVGDSGTILKTYNGGIFWTASPEDMPARRGLQPHSEECDETTWFISPRF
jgi:hypothetical protein